ncbi:MAG: protein-glutamate O-methyltransferase CheR [Desulfuromonadia bacterium]
MLSFASPIEPLGDEEFRLLRDLIHRYCGIFFDDSSRLILEKRLLRRVEALNLTSYRDYYHYLRYDEQRSREFVELMDILTTNETYFFREEYQLKAFTDEILPEIHERKSKGGDRSLRIWSAGCSSGEEPYTISMLLLDKPEFHGWRVEIIGTDISQRVLQIARRGVYGKSAFRATPERHIIRHFIEEEGGMRISDPVRERVSFSQFNLMDSQRLMLLGKMDLIFCRNVIIYFDQEAKRQVIDSFYRMLNDYGFLLLGHAESLMNLSTAFTLRHFTNDMVYQKLPVRREGV